MAPVAKTRGGPKQPDLGLEKFINSLDGVPDEGTLGRLQEMLESLLSERSHPMIVSLSKQLEQFKTAENVIKRELEDRKYKSDASEVSSNNGSAKLKRKHSGAEGSEFTGFDSQEQDMDVDEVDGLEAGAPPATSVGASKHTANDIKPEKPNNSESEDQSPKISTKNGSPKEPPREKTGLKDAKASPTASEDPDDRAVADSESGKIPGNRKFVTNPKSEFVASQSLPYHTFGIFNEDNEDDEDEELYKCRLGVVSYPKEDLSTLTAGPVPMEDYTRAKPTNQVQFSTYATFLEAYFRPFTDEDIHFLQQPAVGGGVEAANLRGGKRLSPFAFPPLGPHYQQQWSAQDAEISGVEPSEAANKAANSRVQALSRLYSPRGSIHELKDQHMEMFNSNVSLGPFTERLVAAVMPETYDRNPVNGEAATNSPTSLSNGDLSEISVDGSMPNTAAEKAISAIPLAPSGYQLIEDFGHLEERVKGEFRYVGVLDVALMRAFEKNKTEYKLAAPRPRDDYADPSLVDMDWINGSEDDEISRELRCLQSRLKAVMRCNAVYKSRLLTVIQEQLAWQEYQSILQDLDKQVDQSYQKRLKQPKALPLKVKKRKDSMGFDSPGDLASPLAAPTPEPLGIPKLPDQKSAIKALLDKRERWITKIGPLFRPAFEMMREYERPKFQNVDDDDGPDDEDEEDREE